MIFVNRKNELNSLYKQYIREDSSFVILYGRRRLGKTALIHQFLHMHPNTYYYMADKEHEYFQINKLKNIFLSVFDDDYLESIGFDTWEQIFDYIIRRADFSSKLVLAIDEFQNLALVNDAFISTFQRIWDTKLKDKNIMLILCGSHVSMMYSTTLAYNSPMYGRRTADIKLQPISFKNWHEFFPKGISRQSLVEFYAITSGIPKYIELLNRNLKPLTNIEKFVLDKDGFFYTEPRFLLSQEINDPTNYFSILRIIATGEHKLGHIAAKLGVAGQKITQYLDILRDLEIVERRVPITEKNPEKSRRGLYFIKDYYIRFWFRFIFPWQSYLEMGNTDFVMKILKKEFHSFTSLVFEDISRQLLIDYCPFPVNKIGSYWSKDIEIDVVGYNEESGEYIFGECKWTKEKMDMRDLQKLISKADQAAWPHNQRTDYFILFSKNGFKPDLQAMADGQKAIILVDFSQ